MLHPSYNELMDYVNENAAPQENGEPLVQSRYTLVMAAAKRARQIVEARSKVQGSFTAADKPLSVAVKELYSGEVRILGENEEPDQVIMEADAAEEENEEAADAEAPEMTETDDGEALGMKEAEDEEVLENTDAEDADALEAAEAEDADALEVTDMEDPEAFEAADAEDTDA